MTTYTPSYGYPKPYIRSFRQRLEKPIRMPDGGAKYKIHLKPDHFRGVRINELRLFVNGEWIHGGGATVFSYVFFEDGDWYLYNSEYYQVLQTNIIAVPGEMTEEEYYSNAIFTHRANAHNTMIPECDDTTPAAFPYISYIDDARLNGRPDLMLILTQVAIGDNLPTKADLHHFAVWYDPDSDYTSPDRVGSLPTGRWAVAYPSRNAMLEGTCFNIMAMGVEEEDHYYHEPYMPRAFAFMHDVNLLGHVETNINTTALDKGLAEKLLEELEIFKDNYPDIAVPNDPVVGYNLIVIASERWDGPEYTEEIIQRQFPKEDWPRMMREKLGTLRNMSEINTAPPAVWYIPPGYVWGDLPIPEKDTDKWAVYVTKNDNIDLIKLNICTRLPCPTYCGGQ